MSPSPHSWLEGEAGDHRPDSLDLWSAVKSCPELESLSQEFELEINRDNQALTSKACSCKATGR